MEKALPAIPAKRYFTIGEVSELCGVKPYVLRYWEQEFTQLKPMKRRGNRRYYQHHEVLLIRRIRELLYEQGFTISGARNRLAELQGHGRHEPAPEGDDLGAAAIPFDDHAALAAGVNGTREAEEPIELLVLDALQGGAEALLAGAGVQPQRRARGAMEAAVEPVAALPVPEVHELSLVQMRDELLSIRKLLTLE
jgi:DNA-binding transcriptional MerR regulator